MTAKLGDPHEPLDVGIVAGHVKLSPSFSQRAQNVLLSRQVTTDYTGARVLAAIWGTRSWSRSPAMTAGVLWPY